MKLPRQFDTIILVLTFIFVGCAIYLALIWTPLNKDFYAPHAQKIFYFHVPAAWVSYLAFGVVFLGSVQLLRTNDKKWDTLGLASAEIGVVFAT
ncbi:MAG: cytochrome c biogenesis protein CcsA, partial [Thermoplasmata archaeon]